MKRKVKEKEKGKRKKMKSFLLFFLGCLSVLSVTSGQFECQCDVPGCCTHTIEHWASHFDGAPFPNDIPWPAGCASTNYSGETTPLWGTTWLAIVQPPQPNSLCGLAAREYIAAVLNKCSGACVDNSVIIALVRIAQVIFDPVDCPIITANSTIPPTILTDIAALRDYNLGLRGPGSCDECETGD